MKNFFYQRNQELLESPVNKFFEEILWMSEDQFKEWVVDMRKEVIRIWDEQGIPPRIGYTEEQIIEQFQQIENFDCSHFLVEDKLDNTKTIIRNTNIIGNAVNQFFPTMMKTKINYSDDFSKGLSIYDHFKNDNLLEKMTIYAHRHFKRDSFYHYSNPIKYDGLKEDFLYSCKTGKEWIEKFEEYRKDLNDYIDYDYWIEPKLKESLYTGYDDKLRDLKFLKLNREEIKYLQIPEKCKTIFNLNKFDNAIEYQIRFFRKKQKIFPLGLKAFRISVCQYAVNFPPLTAKFLYERYSEEVKNKSQVIVWDPSSGWGGRILGAMGVKNDRKIHYIGTDPNTDHTTEKGRTKYHELADFYNSIRRGERGQSILPWLASRTNTYEIYQCGSEVMQFQPEFQKYKGKIDIVFTSPPYFAKELYSEDPEQSANRFNNYESWINGFLKPTLKTAFEWLSRDGYLIWNIADVSFGGKLLNLEQESINYIKNELGLEYIETLKLALAQMPGGNRINLENGKPRAKNFCKVLEAKKGGFSSHNKEIWLKFEPVYVFKKVC